MSGLFSTFNIANRGMSVQQKAIEVTSHNISNANTAGYSRQTARIETSTPMNMPSLNNSVGPGQLGTGSQVASIDRIRDSFLDYQVRNESSTKGQYDQLQTYLGQIENIYNEPSDTGISTLMGKFFDSWQKLSDQPQSSNARTVVAQQSAALADELNHTYTQLQNLKADAQSNVKNTVFDVNNMLTQINDLNQQIIGVKVAGGAPNDLLDKRDNLLDELSAKFNITVDKKSFDGVDVKPVDSNGVTIPQLVKATQDSTTKKLAYISTIEKDSSDPSGTGYVITYYKNGDMTSDANRETLKVTGIDDATYKKIDQCRVLWTNQDGVAIKQDGGVLKDGANITSDQLTLFQPSDGELKGDMSVQKSIDDYTDQLNKVAKMLAFSVNAVQSGMSDVQGAGNPSKDFMPFFVNSSTAQYDSNSNMTNLDGILASEKDITAGNIAVNKSIMTDVMKIKTRKHDNQFDYESNNTIDGETDGSRALAIAQLRDSILKVQDVGTVINSRKDLFVSEKGGSELSNNGMTISNNINGMTMDSYFKDTIDKLGVQSQEAQRMVKNQESLLSSFTESRQSVSGVSLDEEMANLVQFQHAYQANAKVIATIDELLDVVVNGLKK